MTDEGLDSSLLHPDRAGQGWAGQGSQQLLSWLPQSCSTPVALLQAQMSGRALRRGLEGSELVCLGFQLWRRVWLPLGRVLRVGLGVEETAGPEQTEEGPPVWGSVKSTLCVGGGQVGLDSGEG